MFTVEYAKNLKWINDEHTAFECVVKYAEFNEELPAGINATDPYAHIHEIWTKGIAGEYGPIAEYVPPPEPEPAPDQPEPAPDQPEPAPDQPEPAPDQPEPAPDQPEATGTQEL